MHGAGELGASPDTPGPQSREAEPVDDGLNCRSWGEGENNTLRLNPVSAGSPLR